MEEAAQVEDGERIAVCGNAFTADPWRICSAHEMHTAASFFFLSCVAEKCERD